jgi:homoserine dehydrogenase
MTKPLNIAIAGLGTVGSGVARLLTGNAAIIAARGGRRLALRAVLERDRKRERGVDLSKLKWHDNLRGLASDPTIDVVVELIGGSDGVALDLARAALSSGKHVVTREQGDAGASRQRARPARGEK